MTYCVDVITADVSQLKNRGLAYAFTSSPYIITAFAGPAAADAFYYKVSWRWGFGAFAIMFPIVAAPLYGILKANLKKAKKVGNYVEHSSDRNMFQSIWFYMVEFDGMQSKNPLVFLKEKKNLPTDFLVFPLHKPSAYLYSRRVSSSSSSPSTSPRKPPTAGTPATSSP